MSQAPGRSHRSRLPSDRVLAWRWHCWQHQYALEQEAKQADASDRGIRVVLGLAVGVAACCALLAFGLLLEEPAEIGAGVMLALGVLCWGNRGHGSGRHGRGH